MFFVLSRAWCFLYFFTELKTYHLSYSINKHDAIDITDPGSMQDVCHMNLSGYDVKNGGPLTGTKAHLLPNM